MRPVSEACNGSGSMMVVVDAVEDSDEDSDGGNDDHGNVGSIEDT